MATPNGSQGKYDMTQSDETWALFLRLAKWIIGCTIALVVFMALFLTGGHPSGH
jgi:hypothetical protein